MEGLFKEVTREGGASRGSQWEEQEELQGEDPKALWLDRVEGGGRAPRSVQGCASLGESVSCSKSPGEGSDEI